MSAGPQQGTCLALLGVHVSERVTAVATVVDNRRPSRKQANIARQPWTWDPDLLPLGREWAEWKSLQELLMMIQSSTDVSVDLITGFRRAKDLAGARSRGDAPGADPQGQSRGGRSRRLRRFVTTFAPEPILP